MSNIEAADVSTIFGPDAVIKVAYDGGTFLLEAPCPADDVVERMCSDLMRGADLGVTPLTLWNNFTIYVDATSGTDAGMWIGEPSWFRVSSAAFDPISGELKLGGAIYGMVER